MQGAVWLPARGSLADKGRDRQGLHHITGYRKIGLLQFKLGAVGRRDAAHRADRPAAAWPEPTVGSAKAQVLGLHTPAVWLPAAFQTPLQLLQFQGRNVWIQPVHACMAQCQVGGDAYGLPIFHIQPGTYVAHAIQCLYAPGLGPGQGGDLLQLQAGIPLTTPSLPGASEEGSKGWRKAPISCMRSLSPAAGVASMRSTWLQWRLRSTISTSRNCTASWVRSSSVKCTWP